MHGNPQAPTNMYVAIACPPPLARHLAVASETVKYDTFPTTILSKHPWHLQDLSSYVLVILCIYNPLPPARKRGHKKTS